MKNILYASIIAFSVASCKKEDSESPIVDEPTGSKVYIGNEGNFGASNADLSQIGTDGVIYNDRFLTIHGAPLGDVLQSLTQEGTKLYAVLNNSNKVVICDANGFGNVQTIEDIIYPRYIAHLSSSKAYVSTGASEGIVYVLNKTTATLGAAIAVGNGPENMTISNGLLYVCNSGGWGVDNTLSVVDTQTDAVMSTITVGDIPVDAVTDVNGDVWVLCKGQTMYDDMWNVIGHTDARLYHIDELTNTVIDFITVGENGDHPASLAISKDGQILYLANGEIYNMDITASSPSMLILGDFYTVDVSERNGNLWLTSVSDFVNPSTVYQYTTQGTLVSQHTAGMAANCVVSK